MQQQLSNISLNKDFFDAYTNQSPSVFYDKAKTKLLFGRELTNSELGCYSSHYEVWKLLLDSQEDQFFVFEDDVIVDWEFMHILSKYDFSSLSYHLIRFFSLYPLNLKVIHRSFPSKQYHLTITRNRHVGLQGYSVTKRGAEILLATCQKAFLPIDWMMHRYWITGLPTYIFFPFPLTLRSVPSTIDGNVSRDTGFSKSKFIFLTVLFFKFKERLLRELFNLRLRRTAKVACGFQKLPLNKNDKTLVFFLSALVFFGKKD